MSKPTGGAAFPLGHHPSQDEAGAMSGMTLRDYFAGQALVGLFAATANPSSPGIGASDYFAAGVEAYRVADAMLEARGS